MTICFFSGFHSVISQQIDTVIHFQSDEIIFQGIRYSDKFTWSAVKDSISMQDAFSQNVDILLNRQPGLISQNSENPAQDLRISVRGFGARSAFGIRGIKVYFDGIPMTSPDGTSQLDELSLFTLHQIELIRSNFSARLGNAGGGALSFTSEPYFSGISSKMRLNNTGGYDGGITLGYAGQKVSNLLSVNHHVFRGQREHSRGQNTVVYNKTRWNISDKWLVESFLNYYYSPVGQDPGSLNDNAFRKNPLAANPSAIEFNAGEEVAGYNIGIKSAYYGGSRHRLFNTVFLKQRDFTGRLPFQNGGFVDLFRRFYGLHNTYEYAISSNSVFSLGTGFDGQHDDRERFANLIGQRGDKDLDQNESVQNFFVFQQWQKQLSRWGFHQLLRFDHFTFALRDFYQPDGIQKGQKQFSNMQAATGLYWFPVKSWKTFINIGTGFETPTLNEYSNNPENTGGFNPGLSPERSVQAEWGHVITFSKNFRFSSSLYWIEVSDMISGYEIEEFPGRTFYRNSSRVRRFGMESSITYDFSRKMHVSLQHMLANHVFLDHFLNGADLSGYRVPLIPANRLTVNFQHNIKDIIGFAFQYSYQSSFFADDENNVKIAPQSNLQCTFNTGKKVSKYAVIGISLYNLFNLTTYSNIRANAAGSRYYEAASPTGGALFLQYRFQK